MITNNTVNYLFNKYNNLAADADVCTQRHMNTLMMFAIDSDYVDFDGDKIIFAQAEEPLHSIEIERIAGAEDLGTHMAIVLPNSIFFIDKTTGEVLISLAAAEVA